MMAKLFRGFTTKRAEQRAHGDMHSLEVSAGRKTVRGFTLIELMVSVGIFAIVMTLAAGAYLITISAARQAQATSVGIDNLSFALETITRLIRTGTGYSCSGTPGTAVDCASGASTLSFYDADGNSVSFYFVAVSNGSGAIGETSAGNGFFLTDYLSLNVTSLKFYVTGTQTEAQGNTAVPYVTIVVSGTVSVGPGKTQAFTVETAAAMRGTDL